MYLIKERFDATKVEKIFDMCKFIITLSHYNIKKRVEV